MPKHVLAALWLTVSLMDGCGQKGPLVLPPEDAATPQQQEQTKSNK